MCAMASLQLKYPLDSESLAEESKLLPVAFLGGDKRRLMFLARILFTRESGWIPIPACVQYNLDKHLLAVSAAEGGSRGQVASQRSQHNHSS
jgi:hypothetical protein